MSDTGTARAHDSDHDLLIRIDTKLDIYMSSQKDFEKETRDELSKLRARDEVLEVKKASTAVTNDQESRLRRLEKYGFLAIGGLFVIEIGLTLYLGLHHL